LSGLDPPPRSGARWVAHLPAPTRHPSVYGQNAGTGHTPFLCECLSIGRYSLFGSGRTSAVKRSEVPVDRIGQVVCSKAIQAIPSVCSNPQVGVAPPRFEPMLGAAGRWPWSSHKYPRIR
jgi:hypothetical protein